MQPTLLQGKKFGFKYSDINEKIERDLLVRELNSGRNKYEVMMQFKHINYCIYEDKVFDITKISHPGGLYIIDQIRGRDMTKYFYGG